MLRVIGLGQGILGIKDGKRSIKRKSIEIPYFLRLTPTSAVAKSDDFLCDNERQRMAQKNGAFGNPLDVLVIFISRLKHCLNRSLYQYDRYH